MRAILIITIVVICIIIILIISIISVILGFITTPVDPNGSVHSV